MCLTRDACCVVTQAAAASACKKGKAGTIDKTGKKGVVDITPEERHLEETYIQQLLSRASWSEKQITASMQKLAELFNEVQLFTCAAVS